MLTRSFFACVLTACTILGILSGCTAKITAPTTGIDDSVVIESLSSTGVTDVQVHSHNFEEITGSQYCARDIVSLSYQAGNLNGVVPQTVSKNNVYYFSRETGLWELLEETTTACEVDNTALMGSCWKCDLLDKDTITKLMGDEITSGDNGTLYIKMLKNMGLFAFNLENEDYTSTERRFVMAGTSAKLSWVSNEEIVEKKLNITGGLVTDSGEVYFDFDAAGETVTICFGTEAIQIPELDYDLAMGEEIDETKVYLDSLPVIEVTSESIVDGEWMTEIGYMEGNNSPELTWDTVEGATCYAVIMMDVSTNNWLFWYEIVDCTHLDYGAYTNAEDYVGPYPPGTHDFEVYVIALKETPNELEYALDQSTGDISTKADFLNTSAVGNTGNVLAYGKIKAPYTSTELYYGYR